MSFKYKRLDKNDAAVLLIDHQTGLFNLVRDFEPIQFKNNVLALADSAKFFNLPTILTTSFDNGPNGPLLPEIIEMFPEAPLSDVRDRLMPGTMKSLLRQSKRLVKNN